MPASADARTRRRTTRTQPAPPAQVFAALGDPTRLALVTRLCDDGPSSIARLTEGGTVTRQAVTKHLRVLERAGIVTATRMGRETEWRLEQARLAEARQQLDRIAARWDGALARLRAFLPGNPGAPPKPG